MTQFPMPWQSSPTAWLNHKTRGSHGKPHEKNKKPTRVHKSSRGFRAQHAAMAWEPVQSCS